MSKELATNTCGGGCDPTAVIGHAPESREWRPEHGTAGVELGQGVRVEAFCTVDAGLREPTRIGDRSWLLKHVHVGHDAQVGADCELATGTVVGGHVVIGDGVKVGLAAVFRPFVTVGDGARIGCGAVVVSDVPAGAVYCGNPARELGGHMTTEAYMVIEALERGVVQEVIGLAVGLPDDHVAAAVEEITELLNPSDVVAA